MHLCKNASPHTGAHDCINILPSALSHSPTHTSAAAPHSEKGDASTTGTTNAATIKGDATAVNYQQASTDKGAASTDGTANAYTGKGDATAIQYGSASSGDGPASSTGSANAYSGNGDATAVSVNEANAGMCT